MRYVVGILIAALLGAATMVDAVRAAAFSVSSKLPVLLAVLVAAVLVRLARGLPTIPFDKITPAQALQATSAFRLLLKSYSQGLVVLTVAAVLNLLADSFVLAHPWPITLSIYSFSLMFFDMLAVIVMAFLVSADLRVSTLQADLMDQVTGAAAIASAGKSVDTVRGAFAEKRETPAVTQL